MKTRWLDLIKKILKSRNHAGERWREEREKECRRSSVTSLRWTRGSRSGRSPTGEDELFAWVKMVILTKTNSSTANFGEDGDFEQISNNFRRRRRRTNFAGDEDEQISLETKTNKFRRRQRRTNFAGDQEEQISKTKTNKFRTSPNAENEL